MSRSRPTARACMWRIASTDVDVRSRFGSSMLGILLAAPFLGLDNGTLARPVRAVRRRPAADLPGRLPAVAGAARAYPKSPIANSVGSLLVVATGVSLDTILAGVAFGLRDDPVLASAAIVGTVARAAIRRGPAARRAGRQVAGAAEPSRAAGARRDRHRRRDGHPLTSSEPYLQLVCRVRVDAK